MFKFEQSAKITEQLISMPTLEWAWPSEYPIKFHWDNSSSTCTVARPFFVCLRDYPEDTLLRNKVSGGGGGGGKLTVGRDALLGLVFTS